MRNIFSLFCAAIAFLFLYSSCKKTQHPTNPTPGNYRLLSYTTLTRSAYTDQHANNFTFSYDARNRVSQIIMSTNDTAPVQNGAIGTRALFYYGNDTIIKTVTNLRTAALIEKDTFIHNSSNQIITAYVPGKKTINFQYFGKLLARRTDNYYNGYSSVGSLRIYTSDNADFLNNSYDGSLYATFSSSLSYPLSVDWTDILGVNVNHVVNSNSDILNNYNKLKTTVRVTDINNHVDTVIYPGGDLWLKESYGVYPDKANRIGDYLQIASFTNYGINIYDAAHLTKTVKTIFQNTNVTYDIDADSKIKTATAVTVDTAGALTTTIFSYQYELF